MLCYFKSVMGLFKSYCEIYNALSTMRELCFLVQSNQASLFLLEIFSTKVFIVWLVTGCHVVIIV